MATGMQRQMTNVAQQQIEPSLRDRRRTLKTAEHS